MAGIEVMKQKNLESSILFMQQEHANTLKGLHGEIQRLQQRCSELTFQLAMEQTSAPQDQGESKENLEKLENELKLTKKKFTEQEEISQKKDRRIANLEQQIKALDRKYKDELKHKQFNLTKLETELQERCSELAAMRMTILNNRAAQNIQVASPVHDVNIQSNMKSSKKQHTNKGSYTPDRSRYTPDTGLSHSRESSFSSQEDREAIPYSSVQNPVPPLSTSISNHNRHSLRNSNSAKLLTEVKNRPASGRKLVLGDSKDYSQVMPDKKEILKIVAQQKESMDLRQGRGMVVPPIKNIPKDSTNASSTGGTIKKISPRSTNSAAFSKRVRPPMQDRGEKTSSPEIETLAVDQVRNTDLRKAQEFNSYHGGT